MFSGLRSSGNGKSAFEGLLDFLFCRMQVIGSPSKHYLACLRRDGTPRLVRLESLRNADRLIVIQLSPKRLRQESDRALQQHRRKMLEIAPVQPHFRVHREKSQLAVQ